MSSLQINKGLLSSTIVLPRSKSFANRALVLAALSTRAKTIHHVPESTDVSLLVEALQLAGLQIKREQTSLTILNAFPSCERLSSPIIHVGEGGTTARFLACLLLRGSQKYQLMLGDRLKERPWQELIDFANDHGAQAELDNNILTLQGPLKLPAKVDIDCTLTTQFASGIQLAFADTTQVIPRNLQSSETYWKLTQHLVQLSQGQDYFEVPVDWSSASYPLAFGALNQQINFPGLHADPHQADAQFLTVLRHLGAVEDHENGIRVKPVTTQHDFSLNVSDCLDLVPALCFFLSHIKGHHELRGVTNLIYKESDRLAELRKLLSLFHRTTSLKDDILIIEGDDSKMTERIKLLLPKDHRIVMTGTLFLLHHAGGVISPREAVSKSYPGFFDILET